MKWLLFVVLFPLFAHTQIRNPSFEDWFINGLGQRRLVGWQHVQKGNDSTGLVGTSRERNSQHLDFAVKMSRWYDYTWDKLLQHTSINFNPATLTGYYMYSDNDLTGDRGKDSAYVSIFLTRWNALQNRADTIGRGYIELGPSSAYRLFECPILYTMPGTADSLVLDISPSKWEGSGTYCASPGYCSYFTLDNLVLKGNSIGLPSGLTIFPNPAGNKVSINLPASDEGVARIINSLGQLILRQRAFPGINSFDIAALSAGMYFLQIETDNQRPATYKFLKL